MDATEAVLAYNAAWNAADAAERRRLLEASVTDDVLFQDPTTEVRGRDALAALIEAFRARRPGFTFESGEPSGHHGVARFAWAARGVEGGLAMSGMDVAEVAGDGRLRRIVVFVDRVEKRA